MRRRFRSSAVAHVKGKGNPLDRSKTTAAKAGEKLRAALLGDFGTHRRAECKESHSQAGDSRGVSHALGAWS